jgi:hypothetical protein
MSAIQYRWKGDDHPPGWRRVGCIDVGDPADIASSLDRAYRIGAIYRGWQDEFDEPCTADIYERVPDLSPTPERAA